MSKVHGEANPKGVDQNKMPQSLTVSVIIPTKNRSVDLARTIETLLQQTVQPLELIIVDQSPTPSLTKQISIHTHYIHDPTLSGASVARNVAMGQAQGDVWLFLDDDVLLEPIFIEKILEAYDADVTGVSGIITNYSTPALKQRLWEVIFQVGPFRDDRQRIYRDAGRLLDARPIRVRQFGAGLMSFRASAIRNHLFDPNLTGASPGEDIDFCAGLPKECVLRIAPKARLIHNRSPESRDSTHWISVDAQVATYMRERHWKLGLWNNLCYVWLSAGYAMVAAFSSLKNTSVEPWNAWREGIRRGRAIARGQS
jgi:glycosyltransferase involved in cell wall biosynthesis